MPRRRFDALVTALGLGARGFFIPHRYVRHITRSMYPEIEDIFLSSQHLFEEHLDAIDDFALPLLAFGEDELSGPRWLQDWFPRADAAAAYAMVRRYMPGKVVEVGSGHSTRFLAQAVLDSGLETQITCIDPSPKAAITGLPPVKHLPVLAQSVDISEMTVGSGDILFIDSSHVLMPGSDVDIFLNRVCPLLPAGALVHIHDILLPDDYPEVWAWRGYNEQSGVGALLQGGEWLIEWSSHYIATRMLTALQNSVLGQLPLIDGALETSLWLRKITKGS